MLQIKIEDELKSSKEKSEQQFREADVINEVKLLMNEDAAEDMRILRGLGRNHTLTHAENELGKKLELEKLDSGYDGEVYTIAQIKKLAITYNLRFLQTGYFAGKLDVGVVSKIKEFAKNTNTNITDVVLDRRFYILAPESEFNLQKEVKLRRSEADPAIFYQIDEGHYKFIHKWGINFSVFRLISGLKNRSFWGHAMVNFIVTLPISVFIISFLSSPLFKQIYPLGFWFVSGAAAFLFGIFSSIYMLGDGLEVDTDFISEGKWNSTKNIKR